MRKVWNKDKSMVDVKIFMKYVDVSRSEETSYTIQDAEDLAYLFQKFKIEALRNKMSNVDSFLYACYLYTK
jgi:hypothetical protein